MDAVRNTCQERTVVVPSGSIFWRAQLDNAWRIVGGEGGEIEIPCASPPERMKPNPLFANDGRASTKGIPCLYLSSLDKTAIAEVRPWVGSLVSIAQFEMLRELKIVDCSLGYDKMPLYVDEPDVDERKNAVWYQIDRAFARPVSISDSPKEYVPTQILAELFKHEGYDGIGFKSSCCNEGYNLVIFDLSLANLKSCGLQKINMISLDYTEEDQRYFVC